MSNQRNEERTECPYCGEEFEDELEMGIHISEEHTDEGSINRKKRGGRDKNIMDEWET